MRRTLDPTLDVVFKLLFADSKNRDLLIALLTAVLRPKSPIRSVTVLNPEVSKEAVTDKSIVLDILVLCENGTQADVEMQADRRPAWRSRCMFYWAKVYSSQLTPGLPYTTLKPVKVVAFLGYQEFEGDWLHSVFQVQDMRTGKVFSDALELHTIELPKLSVMGEAERQENPALTLWTRFFAATTDEELEQLAKEDPMMQVAHTRLVDLSTHEEAWQLAREREMSQATYRIEIGAAIELGEKRGEERGIELGEKRGIEVGEKRGIEVGEKRGIEVGEKRGIEVGERNALAAAVLHVLHARAIPVTDEIRAAILACGDRARLEGWVQRAVSVPCAEDLLAEGA